MKKYLFGSIAAVVLSMGAAQAQPDSYQSNFDLTLLGGGSFHPDLSIGGGHHRMEDGFNVGARLGYNMDGYMPWSGFSLAGDYFYNQSDYKAVGVQLDSSSFMGDLIYHLPIGMPFELYGGAGLGVVNDSLDGRLQGNSTVFGWQALGGIEYALRPGTSLVAEYRYQNAHDATAAGVPNVGNTSNNLSVGVKFAL